MADSATSVVIDRSTLRNHPTVIATSSFVTAMLLLTRRANARSVSRTCCRSVVRLNLSKVMLALFLQHDGTGTRPICGCLYAESVGRTDRCNYLPTKGDGRLCFRPIQQDEF